MDDKSLTLANRGFDFMREEYSSFSPPEDDLRKENETLRREESSLKADWGTYEEVRSLQDRLASLEAAAALRLGSENHELRRTFDIERLLGVEHGQAGIPAAEEGVTPKVKEIVLESTSTLSKPGSCLYENMWNPNNRSNAVVVGYVDLIPHYEDTRNTAVDREQTRKLCPSAIMINYRPLLALLERIMGINNMPTPCLMVYPFKSLVDFHDKIEDEFRRMNSKVKQETVVDSIPADSKETTKSQPMDKEKPEQVESVPLLDSLGCLVTNLMHNYLRDLLDIRDKIESVSLDAIAYPDLWQLFRPGTTIIQNGNPMSYHKQQAYRIFHAEAPFIGVSPRVPQGAITIYCYSLAYDGITFRPGEKSFRVYSYNGLKDIRRLSVLPVKFAADLESKLQTRGRNFLSHRYGYRRYTGRTEAIHGMVEKHIDDEVFVDFEMGLQYCPPFRDHMESVHPNNLFWLSCDKNIMPSVRGDACRHCQRHLFSDQVQESLLSERFCNSFRPPTWTRGQSPEEWDESQEVLLPPWLIGMRLSSQEFHILSVELIADIEPGPPRASLSNLVLPSDHKAILTAIVNYCNPKNNLSDAGIAERATGGGQGLTVLLHGPPGSGKSNAVKFTAQSAHPPRPVYHMKGGVLPSEPKSFENRLKSDLQLASRWGCVVLLDDAEVYLSERANDVNRNRVVCIFLSILDDFQGVFILTTNRVGLIDEALKARIHIAMVFPRPSGDQKEMILRDQIQQGREHYGPLVLRCSTRRIMRSVERQKYRSGGEGSFPWNARQIQNAFHASVVLAVEDSRVSPEKETSSTDEQVIGDESPSGRIQLRPKHLATVYRLNDDFENYLAECRGNDEERAFESSIRADNFESVTARTGRPYGIKANDSDYATSQTYNHRPYNVRPDNSQSATAHIPEPYPYSSGLFESVPTQTGGPYVTSSENFEPATARTGVPQEPRRGQKLRSPPPPSTGTRWRSQISGSGEEVEMQSVADDSEIE